MDTLEEILESGLRWEMVLYGEPMEDYMAETDKPIVKAIWDGKDVVDFSSVVKVTDRNLWSFYNDLYYNTRALTLKHIIKF